VQRAVKFWNSHDAKWPSGGDPHPPSLWFERNEVTDVSALLLSVGKRVIEGTVPQRNHARLPRPRGNAGAAHWAGETARTRDRRGAAPRRGEEGAQAATRSDSYDTRTRGIHGKLERLWLCVRRRLQSNNLNRHVTSACELTHLRAERRKGS
jgi:hypothetical protein